MNVQIGAAAAEVERVKAETRIVSRCGVAREVEVMAKVLTGMRWEDRRLIEQVTIDSKATWLVQATLCEGDADDAERVACLVEAGMLAELGGHNGVSVGDRGSGTCW